MMGFLAQLALAIVFVKYAYVVLEQSAQGYLKPRQFAMKQFTDELELPFKQLFVIFIMYSANSLVYDNLGEGPFFVTLFISVLSFPASVMVLAVEHSFVSAFNPLIVLVTIRRIGFSYFLLCIFLGLLLTGAWAAMDLTSGVLPDVVTIQVVDFISMYFILIMFHMMGYVIYQYHEKLGYQIEQEFGEDSSVTPATAQSHSTTREIDILIQEGKLDDANQRMQQQLRENPSDMGLWQKYHKFLYVTRDQANLEKYGAMYISRLLHEGKPSRAMQVFMDMRQVIEDFKPDNAAERFELAKLLASNGQARLAMSLLNNLHVDFPSYADTPRAYYLVARLLSEHFNDDVKAKSIIDFVVKKYPNYPDINTIKEYGEVINRLTQH